MNAPYAPPPPAPAGRDRTMLYGILGIVLGLICCGILGIVLGYLSIRDAKRFGQSPVLGYLAIAFGVINIIGSGILRATGNYPFWND
ncbi:MULTISPECIES: hypothetical protein [Micromonospora]|uniref:DUF4190 domain-containing protein n=1 Tax=Micromonospora yangpuensis TaxID=683228 RepID=A0A1C6V9W5_9ACTN|nr:hypothetical protein [Micromonospora yangpuensis]GGM22105.1 hypothetical protein GCM10012279_45560 [Micromonospora yangpuensis]SCL62947.1 hypothetical protein GA0070617_5067 [Micromonospora yangpuensis]